MDTLFAVTEILYINPKTKVSKTFMYLMKLIHK